VNLGTYWGQSPSRDGICRHPVTEGDNEHSSVPAGQGRKMPGNSKRPQQDSNLRSRLRRLTEFRSLTCGNALVPAILGTFSLVDGLSWPFGLEQMADRSVLSSPQTCIKPDDSGQFCSGGRP
jgi:hypothetical protein